MTSPFLRVLCFFFLHVIVCEEAAGRGERRRGAEEKGGVCVCLWGETGRIFFSLAKQSFIRDSHVDVEQGAGRCEE